MHLRYMYVTCSHTSGRCDACKERLLHAVNSIEIPHIPLLYPVMHCLRRSPPASTTRWTRRGVAVTAEQPQPSGLDHSYERAKRTYERTKRSVVWLVKQLDSHLCDLDKRIEERIASRAKARAEGNFEQISIEQNRLGELCIEHKARLDSMLFMWVLGGSFSIAGWVTSALRSSPPVVSAYPPSVDRAVLADALHQEMSMLRQETFASEMKAEIVAGVLAALQRLPSAVPNAVPSATLGAWPSAVPIAPAAAAAAPAAYAAAPVGASAAEHAWHAEIVSREIVSREIRRTFIAAVAACVLSGVTALALLSTSARNR